jgi:hypothetical protein
MAFPPHLTATDFTQLIIGRGFVTAFDDQSVTPNRVGPSRHYFSTHQVDKGTIRSNELYLSAINSTPMR